MTQSLRLLTVCTFLLLSTHSFAAENDKLSDDMKSKIELHEKMATQHQKAADCLKAGGSVEKCHSEAMKDCPMMKSAHCPFMGDHMDGEMGHMMKNKKKK